MAATKITGDLTDNQATTGVPLALALPVVQKTALDDEDHIVNDTNVSGKKPGGMYLAQDGANFTIVTASGTDIDSTWVTVGAGTSATYSTPA